MVCCTLRQIGAEKRILLSMQGKTMQGKIEYLLLPVTDVSLKEGSVPVGRETCRVPMWETGFFSWVLGSMGGFRLTLVKFQHYKYSFLVWRLVIVKKCAGL